ncbi:metallophosphoesterase [Virgibacillus sediminis]|uniref:Metallophosphoesterase n=1 Tax=Virgibacillus sediminis TaxID=202260 RepID=A0ABV7A378_9BACI
MKRFKNGKELGMKRIFFISDIHGNYCLFKKLIDYVEFDAEKDELVIGGDMINGGPRSAEMLQWAKENSRKYPDSVHVIAGNHEEMMIWFMNELSPIWMEFGGEETIKSFKKVYGDENGWDIAEDYASWLETLPLLHEDEHAIYTHAGIEPTADRESQPREILWLNTKELLEMDMQELRSWTEERPIYRGHNPQTTVRREGMFVHCDLAIELYPEKEGALALVDVLGSRYFSCTSEGEVSSHIIEGMENVSFSSK